MSIVSLRALTLGLMIGTTSACSSPTATAFGDDPNVTGVVFLTSQAAGGTESFFGIRGEAGAELAGWPGISEAQINLVGDVQVYQEAPDRTLIPSRLDQVAIGDRIAVWGRAERRSDPPQLDANRIVIRLREHN